MCKDANTRRCNGSAIEIKVAVELRLSGQLGVEPRAAKQIESEESLRQELVPEMHGKILVETAEAGNEVIFERPNGPFGGVASMDTRRNKLKIHLLLRHEFFQGGRAFIVEALQL